ncbi:MAG: polyribonucleotide nucleotidyltransferase [Actinomycetia bacterium]|nr:polyribonucleotide nucleotidyltransferase [Actinomycetes bacterium]
MSTVLDMRESTSALVGGREITFETGELAKQADGAVVARVGETMLLATAHGRPQTREGADFFPLTVDVEEKMYAAGKIPGGFFKREGRPTERAILNARMIDRPIRPLWPSGYTNEVQVIVTTLSVDLIHAHDVLAINATSAALMISSLPFQGPVGAVRIGLDGESLVIDPTLAQLEESSLDLLVVGTKAGITMVEAGASEVPEDVVLGALELAHREIQGLCEAQERLRVAAGKPKQIDDELTDEIAARHGPQIAERIRDVGPKEAAAVVETLEAELAPPITMDSTEQDILRRRQVRVSLGTVLEAERLNALVSAVRAQFEADIRALTEAEQDSKELKSAKRDVLLERIVESIELPWLGTVQSEPADDADARGMDQTTRQLVKRATDSIYKELVRAKIAVEKRRPDGRGAKEVRAVSCRVGVAPRTHGSGLFTRGQTQILTLLTLGTAKEGQRIDDLSLEEERHFIHHYNFPPFSVGETGFMRGPKRRDIGHGALAQRALEPVIPSPEEFPYTMRLVSETLESNGSSSMGSVCGSTLALLDAGVKIHRPVAGIAMGLIKEGGDYVILTDIQGAEDHLGDMDFKVAGTRKGITALQMDIKITGVTRQIMSDALEQALRARHAILDRMAETIGEPREELADHAPRITAVEIDPEQIGLVIGKGGETIRALEAEHGVQIDIDDDGTVLIYADEGVRAKAAADEIRALTKEPEVGDTYTGKVVRTTDFGAFVELKKGLDGLLHVSNVGPGRVGHIEDVIARGDLLDVFVKEVDKARGRIGLKLVNKHEDGTLVGPKTLIERAAVAPPRERENDSRDGGRRRDRGRSGGRRRES